MTKDQDIFASGYQEELLPQCYEDAFKLLGETRKLREELVPVIQQWLRSNPHINAHNEPKTILSFLRGSKFDVEKTKQKIKW